MVGRKIDKQYERLMEICVEIALENKCRPSDVFEVYDTMFQYTRRAMGMPQMPTVYLKYFGTFSTSAASVRVRIKELITKYRAGKVSKASFGKFMAKAWPTYKKLQEKEVKLKRNGRK